MLMYMYVLCIQLGMNCNKLLNYEMSLVQFATVLQHGLWSLAKQQWERNERGLRQLASTIGFAMNMHSTKSIATTQTCLVDLEAIMEQEKLMSRKEIRLALFLITRLSNVDKSKCPTIG